MTAKPPPPPPTGVTALPAAADKAADAVTASTRYV